MSKHGSIIGNLSTGLKAADMSKHGSIIAISYLSTGLKAADMSQHGSIHSMVKINGFSFLVLRSNLKISILFLLI